MRLREEVKGVLGIVLFYLVIIVGIILLINNAQKSVDAETSTPHTNVNYKVNK
jgi:hypothetical protein